jgi:hypothetical protein
MPPSEDVITPHRTEPHQAQLSAWVAFWQNVIRFQWDKVSLWLALRNTLGVTLPLAAGGAFLVVGSGLIACTGALNVSFSDSQQPYIQRAGLETGLYSSQPVPARDAFRRFANDVEMTLYYLAAALRGSPLTRDALPDLREDHHALVHSGESLTERYALVNVETDRITNSLNTLSEQLLEWIGSEDRAKGRA